MRRSQGFTLIELIMGIVILGIVAVISTQFVSQSSEGYQTTAERQKLAVAASVASEKLSRELREAVPNSIRVLSATSMNCVEFLPALAVTDYLDATLATSVSSISAVGIGESVTAQVAVYPIDSSELYSPANPGTLTTGSATLPAGPGAVTINLSAAHRFTEDAPSRRLYMVGSATAYCHLASSDQLQRYTGYSASANVSGLPAALASASSRAVVVADLDTAAANRAQFNYNVPTLNRNAVVTMKLAMHDPVSGERFRFSQEVQIRNVP